MIRSLLYDPASSSLVAGGLELVDTWKADDRTVLWLDLMDVPEEQERELMIRRFGLHRLAVQDAQRQRHPPKVEAFGDHTFLLLKGLDAQSKDLDFGTIQIAIFIGPRFLLTRHTAESPSINKIWSEAEQDPAVLTQGTDALALLVSRTVVHRYLPILLSLEVRLDELEDEMMANPTDELLAELVGHKANLKKLRRIFAYHVTLFDTIKASMPPGMREELRHEVNDVYDHLERAMSLTTLYYELASDLMDGYITLASHRLNNIVKILTIVTTIFVPLSFLAGVYGMNFENMPELRSQYGYFIVLGLMGFAALSAVLLMRKLGWMGERKGR